MWPFCGWMVAVMTDTWLSCRGSDCRVSMTLSGELDFLTACLQACLTVNRAFCKWPCCCGTSYPNTWVGKKRHVQSAPWQQLHDYEVDTMLKKILIRCQGRILQAGFVSGHTAIQLFLNAQAGIASKLLATAQQMQKKTQNCACILIWHATITQYSSSIDLGVELNLRQEYDGDNNFLSIEDKITLRCSFWLVTVQCHCFCVWAYTPATRMCMQSLCPWWNPIVHKHSKAFTRCQLS